MKQTEQIQRERTEKYTEEVEYWLWNSCQRESKEDQLVPMRHANLQTTDEVYGHFRRR